MSYSDVYVVRSSDLSCSLKIQYHEKNNGLYTKYEVDNDKTPLNKFYELCQKMNSIQRKFFIEPVNPYTDSDKLCVFCPGFDVSMFYFPKLDKSQESCYKLLTEQDKMYIMKWIFSVACAIQILLQNNFEIIKIFVRSFFIDSNMEARFSYASWETEYERYSTLIISQYFIAPENLHFRNSQNNTDCKYSYDVEKECSYSLGVLMSALLNKRLPNVYLSQYPRDVIVSKLKEGHIYKENIPQCEWNEIISNCINIDPTKRPTIKSIIQQLIQEKNCLSGVDYNEFKKYVAKKFNSNEKTDLTQLFKEKIEPNLSKISENSKSSIVASKFRVSNIPQFLELCKNTSFEQGINANCQNFLQSLFKILQSSRAKNMFQSCQSTRDPYKLMDELLKQDLGDYDYDEEESEIINNNDNINFNCLDNMNDNSSFYIRIYKNNAKINLVFPQELKIPDDYFDHFNNEKFFVYIENKLNREIEFYPFLNVYNVLYGNSSNCDFNITEKVKWLYQTAEALSILHEKKYTVKYFNSTNIFIDINLDAHFLPSQIIKIQSQNQFDTDFLENSDFIISYLAPEVISDVFNFSDPEKQVVYSFGIFILELVYDNRPDQLLANLSSSEKIKLLVKERKIFIKQDDSLYQIVKSCLDQSPENRKSFKEIASSLTDILNEKNKTDETNKNNDHIFYFSDLEEAANKGATMPNVILNYIYKTFDIDKQLTFDHYNSKISDYKINKFKLVWAIYTNDDIKPEKFNDQLKDRKIRKKKKFNYVAHQNSNNSTKSQFNSFNDFTKDYLEKFDITMKKVHNKSNNTSLHLSGLTIQSARNLILRFHYNINDEYHQQTEYAVRNTYDFPYGDTLKMKNVEDIVKDMFKKKIFKPNSVISTTKNGNLKVDSQLTND